MYLGIFAKTFARASVEEVFDAVKGHGLSCVQFNMACAGVPSLPDEIAPALIHRIREAAQSCGIEIAAVSGTYNMIHPDPFVQKAGLRRLRVLAAACRSLGTPVITLCTGTRDPENMWHWHPENASPASWADLLRAMEAALKIADEEQVTLAFEPERANVVNSAAKGAALLAEMQSSRLKVVMDAANLIGPGDEQRLNQVLEEAFNLLGEQIVIAHAKDRAADDTVRAAGSGVLDYAFYLKLLHASSFTGPVIIHGLSESEVDRAVQFLDARLRGR